MTSTLFTSSKSYWFIAILALIWNFFGVLAYLGQAFMTDDILMTLPQNEQSYYSALPSWVVAAFALAVFGGFFGAIGLLMKKKWAFIMFTISFVALLFQSFYNFFIQGYIEISGFRMILPVFTIIISIFLIYFSKSKLWNSKS